MTAAAQNAGSLVQRRVASAANPHPPAALFRVTDTRRPATRTDDHHVGDGKRRFLLRNPAFDVPLRVGTPVLFHHHHVFHQHFALAGKHAQYASLLAFVATSNHFHLVITLDVDSCMHCQPSTIGSPPSDRLRFLLPLTTLPEPAKQSSKTSSRAAR